MKTILSLRGVVFFSAVLIISLFILSATSFAATFTVTNLNDSGAGSLRQAILDANGTGTVDEIVFDAALMGTILLQTGEMAITDDLTITGPGADVITIDADITAVNDSRIFNIDDDVDGSDIVVSISGLRFINGDSDFNDGGAIQNLEELSIDSCVFEANSAELGGGAIINQDSATITEVSNSTFSGNSTDDRGGGGAILNDGTITEITNSTFSGNIAELGGAIYNEDGTIEQITNSTFTGNMAGIEGGAIWNLSTINISFTTIANNAANAGGGIFEQGASTTNIRNSLVVFNEATAGPNCNKDIAKGVVEINNYSNDRSCGFDGDDSTILVGLLADNGGPTQTIALLGGDPLHGASPDCDAINNLGVRLPNDQRFFPRPFGAACDAGSYEAEKLLNITEEPPGENCELGGVKIETGLDLNDNGVLDPNEVQEVSFVCDEAAGERGGSGSSCSLAPANSISRPSGVAGLLGYILIPAAVLLKRRFRRK